MANNSMTAVIIPITVAYSGRQIDVSVPSTVPFAEILPGIVDELGRLTVNNVSQGFRLVTHLGTVLDQDLSLSQQRVRAGALLRLEEIGSASADIRYDDLVEAMGQAVDSTRAPWTKGDSVNLSAYSAAGLLVVAAGMLVVSGLDSITAAIVGLVGAALVALSASIVARVPAPGPATALIMAGCSLAGAGSFCLYPAGGLTTQLMIAGAGVIVAALAAAVLPDHFRPAAAAPMLVGLALVAFGGLTGIALLPEQQTAVLIIAIISVLTCLAAWIGLAQVPLRIDAFSITSTNRMDADKVTEQVQGGSTLVLALRVGGGIITIALTLFVTSTVLGGVFMLCVGLSLLLGTRSLYGRLEVLVGLVVGMLTVLITGIAASVSQPQFRPIAIGVAIFVAALVLANNVISIKLRPALSRVGDTLQIIALIALLPLAVMAWGIF